MPTTCDPWPGQRMYVLALISRGMGASPMCPRLQPLCLQSGEAAQRRMHGREGPMPRVTPSQSHDGVRPRQARAERHEDRDVTLAELARADRFIERDRNAGGRGVAVAVDVDERFLRRNLQ